MVDNNHYQNELYKDCRGIPQNIWAIIFPAFIIPKVFWARLLIQKVLTKYQFFFPERLPSDLRNPKSELNSKIELVVSISES